MALGRVHRILWALLLSTVVVSCSAATARPPGILGSPLPPPAARHYASSSAPRIVLPPSPLSADQQVLHALNRVGYGPRPGDLERVKQMGLAAYLRQQLDPVAIPDSSVEQA